MQHPEIVSEARTVLEVLDFANEAHTSGLPQADIDQMDHEVAEAIESFEDAENRRFVLNAILARAQSPELQAKKAEIDDAYFGHGIFEASRDDIPDIANRLLEGRNAAFVIRASEWHGREKGALGIDMRRELAPLGRFEHVRTDEFPNKNQGSSRSSLLHLDNFVFDPRPGYRYSLSASEITAGHVLFVVGLARGKVARDTSIKYAGIAHPYEIASAQLNDEAAVRRQFKLAEKGRPNPKSEITTGVSGTELASIVLNPGDVAVWPQGGPDSAVPAWHAFRQIGNEPRTSTSYHFVKEDV